jgi:hypothetical protein
MIDKRFPGAIFMKKLEKEFIPLIFLQMNLDGSSVYQRLDTKEKIDGEYVEMLCKRVEVMNVPYNGIGKIKIPYTLKGALEKANGLVLKIPEKFSTKHLEKEVLCSGEYCYIDEKAVQKKSEEEEEYSELGSGLTIE